MERGGIGARDGGRSHARSSIPSIATPQAIRVAVLGVIARSKNLGVSAPLVLSYCVSSLGPPSLSDSPGVTRTFGVFSFKYYHCVMYIHHCCATYDHTHPRVDSRCEAIR